MLPSLDTAQQITESLWPDNVWVQENDEEPEQDKEAVAAADDDDDDDGDDGDDAALDFETFQSFAVVSFPMLRRRMQLRLTNVTVKSMAFAC